MRNGYEMLKKPLVSDFWRAPTDNDFGNKMPKRCKVWKNVMQNAKITMMDATLQNNNTVTVNVVFELPDVEGKLETAYTIHSNGKIDVDYSFKAEKDKLPEIPRIGMVLQLPKEFDNLKYYGRGPYENYCDRKTASFIGIYQSKVAEQYFAYSRPQENGHKTDVRWFMLKNQFDMGFKIVANGELLEFNALHYSTTDLDPGTEKKLRTPLNLTEGDFVELHIDHRMMGVGGDNSWGAKPHKPYMFFADKVYKYSFSIIPF